MAYSYGKSTYDDIIADVERDINEPDKIAQIAPESFQSWILDAEKQICDRMLIEEQYILGLNEDVKKYYYRDRPLITGATNATPIVITSTTHGLTVGDRIWVNGVQGNTAANGQRYVSAATTDTFTIKWAGDITDATNTTPIVITVEEHGLATGDTVTITGVLGNTAANVANNAITILDVNTFSLTGTVGNAAYTSGGLAVKNTVGSGTYTSGGRYWKDDELPTYFKKFFYGDRLWGSEKHETRSCDMSELRMKEREVSVVYGSYGDYYSPLVMAEGNFGFERFQEFYPAPYEDTNITLYGQVKITPKDYTADPTTATIHLSTDYDEAIKLYVIYKLYWFLKEYNISERFLNLFEIEIKSTRSNSYQPLVKRIVYR
jgi:hypothetical protein